MLRLVIQTPSGESRFESGESEILVGRREGVGLYLEDQSVALTHCLLRIDENRVVLVDLGSEAGTQIHGKAVRRARLAPGATFQVGKTKIKILSCGQESVAQRARTKSALAGSAPSAPAAAMAAQVAAPIPNPDAGPDFGREIREMLAKAPWYGISLVAHIIGLLILNSLAFQKTEFTVFLPIESSVGDSAPAPEEGEELPDINMEDLAPEDEMLAEMEKELESGSPEDAARPAEGEPSDETVTPITGLNRSTPTLTRLSQALPRKSKTTGAAETVNRRDLATEHEGAADIIRKQLGRGGIPRGISKNQIVVVEGEFDSMEKVLREYGIAFTGTTRDRLLVKNYPAAKLLCINCGHQPPQAKRAKLVAKIKSFVKRGGWVVTSDWALDPYITMAWPHIVEVARVRKHQVDTTVEVSAVRSSPLLVGVFTKRVRSRWWLEEASKFFKLKSRDAHVLVESREMDRRYGASPIAFEFEDRGRVVHLMGHFYQKDGNRQGLVGMHRLVINLIRERFQKSRRE